MATLKLVVDMRRAKKYGTYPLVFKCSVNRETKKTSNLIVLILENSTLTLYPNPSNGTVYLTTTSTEQLLIQVISIAGQVVKEQQMDTATLKLDLNSLANGIYTIHAVTTSGTTSKIQKLILAK